MTVKGDDIKDIKLTMFTGQCEKFLQFSRFTRLLSAATYWTLIITHSRCCSLRRVQCTLLEL